MKKTLIFVILFLAHSQSAYSDECVILLHGLAKTNHSMAKIAQNLEEEGYSTVNYDYPSRKNSIEKLAQMHIPKALNKCPKTASATHFVTHSMGGILVRHYLSNNIIENLGKVIMLGPPNQGSEVVDKLFKLPGYSFWGGPSAQQLGTRNDSIPKQLGPADFELGIIAGSSSINLILSTMLPNQDDGKVTVESTKLEGMSDHLTLPVTHPFMMKNATVISNIKHFLKYGKFYSEAS